MIEEPLEAASEEVDSSGARYEEIGDESDESDKSICAPMVRETPPGYGNPIHDSRESSLPKLSGELEEGRLEPISCGKRVRTTEKTCRERVKRRYHAAGDGVTHVSHGSSPGMVGRAW